MKMGERKGGFRQKVPEIVGILRCFDFPICRRSFPKANVVEKKCTKLKGGCKMKSSKRTIVQAILLVSLGLVACSTPNTDSTDTANVDSSVSTSEVSSDTSASSTGEEESAYKIEDFFPNTDNLLYEYEGSGMEYAGFKEYTDYSSNTRKQYRRPNDGTTVAEVIELQDDQIAVLFHEGEVYYRENMLKKSDTVQEILLQAPFEIGHSWDLPEGRTKTITGLDVPVVTPYGEFTALEVTTEFDNNLATETMYYAPDIGLVKSVYQDKETEESEAMEIVTELKEIKEQPYVHQIRFFYPDFENERIVATNKEVSMNTNDETKKVLAKAYKDVPGDLVSVLSPSTVLNSFYLNKDGRVYADFTRQLIDEMNAGAFLETQILQSLVNTLGTYFGVEEVSLTVEGRPYQSGHVALERGEFFKVRLDDVVEENR